MALRGLVHIHPAHAQVIYVQVHRIAENDELEHGRHEEKNARAPVPEHLAQLFANYGENPFPHALPLMPASASSYAPPSRKRGRRIPPETATGPTTNAGRCLSKRCRGRW